jgi:cytochrome bd-type quinol oxidase subunit 1
VEEGVRILAVGIGQFLFDAFILLEIVVGLVLFLAPFVGLGLAAYYVFRGRVSRWALRALVLGIPLAIAVACALIIGGMVIYVNAISE